MTTGTLGQNWDILYNLLYAATLVCSRRAPLPLLLETCWVRGLDRFDGKTEAVRFQMSSEPRCATCLVTVRQHSIALIQTALGRPQETAQKPCYTPPGTRQRGAVGAG